MCPQFRYFTHPPSTPGLSLSRRRVDKTKKGRESKGGGVRRGVQSLLILCIPPGHPRGESTVIRELILVPLLREVTFNAL